MKENIMKYIESHFPNLTSEWHLRFELGEPYENGTEDRLNQVVKELQHCLKKCSSPMILFICI